MEQAPQLKGGWGSWRCKGGGGGGGAPQPHGERHWRGAGSRLLSGVLLAALLFLLAPAASGSENNLCSLVPRFTDSYMWAQVAASSVLAVQDVGSRNCSLIPDCETLLPAGATEFGIFLHDLGLTQQSGILATDACVGGDGGNVTMAVSSPEVASAVSLYSSSFNTPHAMPVPYTPISHPPDALKALSLVDETVFARALMSLVNYFGWKEVVLFYNNANTQPFLTTFSQNLDNDIEVVRISYEVSASGDNIGEGLKTISELPNRLVVVVDAGGPVEKVFLRAEQQGLASNVYQWIVVDPFFYPGAFGSAPDPARLWGIVQGAIVVQAAVPISPQWEKLARRLDVDSSVLSELLGTTGGPPLNRTNLPVSGLAAYVYDTVWSLLSAYLVAVQELAPGFTKAESARAIHTHLLETDFVGVSGHLAFNSKGFRKAEGPALEILSCRPGGRRGVTDDSQSATSGSCPRVGTFTDGSEVELVEGAGIRWRQGSTYVVGDGDDQFIPASSIGSPGDGGTSLGVVLGASLGSACVLLLLCILAAVLSRGSGTKPDGSRGLDIADTFVPVEGEEVTLVVTDVQSSTTLWDKYPAAMNHDLELHNSRLRSAMKRFNGYEIGTEGDSFKVAFQQPADAVGWALFIQEDLRTVDWSPELVNGGIDEEMGVIGGISTSMPGGPGRSSSGEPGGGGIGTSSKFGLRYMSTLLFSSMGGGSNDNGSMTPGRFTVRGGGRPGDSEISEESLFRGLRVRAGVHTGIAGKVNVDPRTNLRVIEGEVLNVAKAVSDAANGGQVLLSGETLATLVSMEELDRRLTVKGYSCHPSIMHLGQHNLQPQETNLALGKPEAGTRGQGRKSGEMLLREAGRTNSFTKKDTVTDAVGEAVGHEEGGPSAPVGGKRNLPALKLQLAETYTRDLIQILPGSLRRRSNYFQRPSTVRQVTPSFVDAPSPDNLTIVFTYVDGVAKLEKWNQDLLQQSIKLHNVGLRAMLREFSGYECNEQNGNFVMGFSEAASAVQWCLATQEALMRLHWDSSLLAQSAAERQTKNGETVFRGLRVQMGVTTGRAIEKRASSKTGRAEYYGPLLNHSARIATAGHGGQVLVSGQTMDQLTPQAKADLQAVFRNLGLHRLKGVQESVRIYQISEKKLDGREFPAIQTKGEVSEPPPSKGASSSAKRASAPPGLSGDLDESDSPGPDGNVPAERAFSTPRMAHRPGAGNGMGGDADVGRRSPGATNDGSSGSPVEELVTYGQLGGVEEALKGGEKIPESLGKQEDAGQSNPGAKGKGGKKPLQTMGSRKVNVRELAGMAEAADSAPSAAFKKSEVAYKKSDSGGGGGRAGSSGSDAAGGGEGGGGGHLERNVLIAEDNAVNIVVLTKLLSTMGITSVQVVSDGAEVLDMVRVKRYTYLLVDMHLPTMDGLTLSRLIRHQLPLGHQPNIIIVSADPTLNIEKAYRNGADYFLPKPITKAKLKTAMEQCKPYGIGSEVDDHIAELVGLRTREVHRIKPRAPATSKMEDGDVVDEAVLAEPPRCGFSMNVLMLFGKKTTPKTPRTPGGSSERPIKPKKSGDAPVGQLGGAGGGGEGDGIERVDGLENQVGEAVRERGHVPLLVRDVETVRGMFEQNKIKLVIVDGRGRGGPRGDARRFVRRIRALKTKGTGDVTMMVILDKNVDLDESHRVMNLGASWVVQEMPMMNYTTAMLRVAEGMAEGVLAARRLQSFYQVATLAGESVEICDQDNVYQYINPAFETITGYQLEDIKDKTTSSTLRSDLNEASVFESIESALAEGRVWRGTYIGRRKDGYDYYQDAVIAPVQDVDGNVVNTVSIKRDITHDIHRSSMIAKLRKDDGKKPGLKQLNKNR